MSRTIGQFAIRFIQRTKDQAAPKSDPAALKSLKDSTSSKCNKFGAVESQNVESAEESLRTVMFLSSWAPT